MANLKIIEAAVSLGEANYPPSDPEYWASICPYGQPGDRLWVRETFLLRNQGKSVIYKADYDPVEAAGISGMYGGWRPSIHMPRWASRLTLEITEVRVQRLQDIKEEDAKAEGIDTSVVDPSPTGISGIRAKNYVHAKDFFADLWRLMYGHENWDSNPWVWAITFRKA